MMENFILNIENAIKYKLDCNDDENSTTKMNKIKINEENIYDVF